ncbi:hypothetical protein [Actinopolymorpha alba]|uniref:hypothetical protein n=1 Tax=Actinopolymorpha alba TaxID=533267 RepID=UPI0012F6C906|nr:hypothetical protein [Actinopolymorpha alba]
MATASQAGSSPSDRISPAEADRLTQIATAFAAVNGDKNPKATQVVRASGATVLRHLLGADAVTDAKATEVVAEVLGAEWSAPRFPDSGFKWFYAA